ncbi:MAG TPA: hypothetical protein VKB52_11500 [Rhodanobacteraceae bacterium]|nr:hypothetical protein [Rhodanobacteraceae bacterium]
MSAHDPDRELDALLGEGGGKIGDLYRRLPRYEPPRRLDRAVLGEAARAVHSGKPPRRQRWIVGVGSAAGLVLAAGIAWRIGHDAMSPSEAPATETRRVVPVEPIDEAARAKHEELAQPKTDADAASAPASNAAGEISPRQDTAPQKEIVHKTRASAKPATPPAIAEPPKPAPAPAAAPPPQAFTGAAEQRARAQDDFEKSGKDKLGVSETGAAAADKRAPAAARGVASPTVPSGSIELQRDMQLAPHDWLAHIRQLMQQGRTQQATESLRLFVRSHPDVRVPDDLSPLLD